jgi:mannose/fructose/N-acetylgalactosamine-specific phosphotransferase system component IIB
MKLVNNSMALNEVVVAGYASKPKKVSLTGSVTMISNDLLKQNQKMLVKPFKVKLQVFKLQTILDI